MLETPQGAARGGSSSVPAESVRLKRSEPVKEAETLLSQPHSTFEKQHCLVEQDL
ncbi:hypothetical protein [Jeotgalibacillus campisalis]|uniref:Uncharacterized protein n=1 Tax=Jeotgalibacillus campisalis TaxID=220754 RepID=A0A0C2VJR0_9BACL|nr:hypothetical protein [Jeotgalibacillus campisalis]KIL49112.1 hypothetical protein KR50_11470 [Jeotgalibacillus campisalis]